jgi:hypothetical protein
MFVQNTDMGMQGGMKKPRRKAYGQYDMKQTAPGRLINWSKGMYNSLLGPTPTAPTEGDQFSGRAYYSEDE